MRKMKNTEESRSDWDVHWGVFRYYVDNSTATLIERWFHCKDLGSELVPIIKE